jgi:hypothetical protein
MEQGSGKQLPDHVSRYLAERGVDKDTLEPDALSALATISPDELQGLARIRESLEKAGLSEHVIAQIV